jgi:hypothetical protein
VAGDVLPVCSDEEVSVGAGGVVWFHKTSVPYEDSGSMGDCEIAGVENLSRGGLCQKASSRGGCPEVQLSGSRAMVHIYHVNIRTQNGYL